MTLLELIVTAVGLSMDAFAVAAGYGVKMQSGKLRGALIIGAYFGVFQALMPLLGYLLGSSFAQYIMQFSHYIAFGLLAVIGIKMILESLERKKESGEKPGTVNLSPGAMLPLAVATSIDALAAGVSFAFLQINIVTSISLIGAITFTISAAGVIIGSALGAKLKSIAEPAGGAVLLAIGIKIMVEGILG